MSHSQLDSPAPPDEFIQGVRNVLDHLYDHAYLLKHPLIHELVVDPRLDQISRAQQMRRTLLRCIEALQPQANAGSAVTRTYSVLMYRCVDGLAMPAIAAKLTLSERQVYREYTKGIEAIARVLWTMRQSQPRPQAMPGSIQPEQSADRLALAKAEAERLQAELSVEMVTPTEVLHAVCALLTPRIRQTGTEILISAPDPCPQIVADRTMLRQALLSLLSHTLDAVAEQSRIKISISGVEELQITISGVREPTVHDRLTSPGQAVGLVVAQMLLQGQGGDLHTETQDGLWQSRLILPMAQTVTILVVDDNAGIRTLFQRYLAGHKVSVLSATNREQALKLASEFRPQLIFLDLMLPHHDGWEILQELKQNTAAHTIPIVVCSVLNEKDLALAMGANDYLTKPVSQTALLDVLRRWLERLRPLG